MILTDIQVEARKLLIPHLMGLLIFKDPEINWIRTYGIRDPFQGWKRFPTSFILERSVPAKPQDVQQITRELEAKGYKCTFCNIINLLEKETSDGDQDNTMEAQSEI